MGGKKKIILKITGWFFLSLVFLLLAAIVVAWLKLPGLINKEMERFVLQKSGGLYQLSIEKTEPQIFPFAVKIRKISLSYDKEKMEALSKQFPEKTFYNFSSEQISVEGVDFKSFLKEKKFICRKIRVRKPEIKLSGEDIFQKETTGMADKMVGEIRPVFDNYLKSIFIKSIEFTNADFGFYGLVNDSLQVSKGGQVSLEVRGFKTDSAMVFRQNHFFDTENVLVKMLDFKNSMGDSLHVATIDTLEYSLKSTDIRAVNFQLSPLFRQNNKNLYEVQVPEVYVKSKSITHFALNDSIKITYLEFNRPKIKFYQKEKPNRLNLEKINNFNLYTLIQNQFKKLEVDSFFLNEANLEIYRQPDYERYQQRFNSVNITLNGFALDSTSAQNTEKLLHSDDIELQVSDYQLRLDDNQHDFKADSLFVSTFANALGAKKIAITPHNPQEFFSRTEVNIECEALNIRDIDLRDLYHTRTMPSSGIEIMHPDVQLTYHLDRKKAERQKDAGLLFDLVTDYMTGVYTNLVHIENGKLNIQNLQDQKLQGFFETNFSFSLTDFTLDSTSLERTDKFFYATNFELGFSDYRMRLVDDLHQLKTGKIKVSSISQQVQIENLKLEPVLRNVTFSTMKSYNRSELYNISVPLINLNGVDLNTAFFNKKLRIDHFEIEGPEIYFENFGTLRKAKGKMDFTEFYNLVFNYLEDFDIKRFSAPNGKLTWVNHTRKGKTISFDNAFSASLENFRLNEDELNKKRLFFSDNFDVTIEEQQFELSDSVHILKAGQIMLSSANSLIQVKDALLYPVITSDKYRSLPTTFQVTIPELKISNFDFPEAYYSQKPVIEKLELLSPKFQVYSQSKKRKSFDFDQYQFPMPSFIHSLKLGRLDIRNARVITYKTEGIDHLAQANFKLNLSMPNVLMKNTPDNQAQLTSDNIVLQISDFKSPLGEHHNFSLGKLLFNRSRQSITVDSLQVEPFLPGPGENSFCIFAPSINFSAFDLNTALNANSFVFDELNILNPDIEINVNKKIQNDTLEFLQTLDLYPYVEPYLDKIQVNSLQLSDARLNFNWLKKELFDNKINLEFSDILIAENQPPANLLNSGEFEISTSNLRTKSKDNLYEFAADSLSYHSLKHRVLLSNLSIKPLIKKEEFPKRTGYQTDVAEAQIDFVELQGIDEKKWFSKNILDAGLLKIGPARLTVFRNKRYPFNPNQRPPWPQDLIKNIRQPFIFDSVMLMPSHVRYSELMGISDQPGFIDFKNLTLTANTLSNIPEVIGQQPSFNMNASALIFGKAKLEADFSFNLNSPDYFHSVTGSLEPMPLIALNPMLEKAAPMSIENGQLNRFEFDYSFNSKYAQGLLYFGYNDLKIAVMKYNSNNQQKDGLASFWVNKLVLNTKNPKGQVLEPVPVYYERDIKRSILNYWWKSIYSGAKEVLGLEKKK